MPLPRHHLALGDVFTIPIDESRFGVGQIVGKYLKDAYYVVVYNTITASTDEPATIVSIVSHADPLLLALTFDAKFRAGHWRVVGNADLPPAIRLPAHKEMVGSPGRVDVVDYSGRRRRPATGNEASTLQNREVVAPVRIEKAARSAFGTSPWEDSYDRLRVTEPFPDWRLYFPAEIE